MEKDGLTLDTTVISDGEEDEDYDDGIEGGAEVDAEMIEEEEEYEGFEAGASSTDENGLHTVDEKSEEEPESVTEDESPEKQEELMDSTEKIVLQEMRREIERMEHRKREGGGAKGGNEDIDYTTVSDGELLKFLRARRYETPQLPVWNFPHIPTYCGSPLH